jgi:hypothetical protein|tara:strand:- start:553 stop:1086 length:534 start_codon:yes stop_codon:yes gene_type:complete
MKIIIAALLFITSISTANAGFIGKTLDAYFESKNINGSNFFSAQLGRKKVGVVMEWEHMGFLIDAGDKSIVIEKKGTIEFKNYTLFSGWIFTDDSGLIDDIAKVTIDSGTSAIFDQERIIFNENSIFLDFSDIKKEDGIYVKVKVEFDSTRSAVPEPSIIALFGLGLAGLGLARRPS